MSDSPSTNRASDQTDDATGLSAGLWPSADYHRQIERLRDAIGETIYLVELVESAIQLAVHLTDTPFVLLGVIDFPRPDPARGLAPHLILLDDGRGVNLGRIARVTRDHAFNPAPADLLYLDREAHQSLLFNDRRLSCEFIAQRSTLALGQVLGQPNAPALDRPQGRLPGPDDGTRDGDDA